MECATLGKKVLLLTTMAKTSKRFVFLQIRLNTRECCYDNGDCLMKESVSDVCPTCSSGNNVDGKCDLHLNTSECCFDSGDCLIGHRTYECNATCCFEVRNPYEIGDFICDIDCFSTCCCLDGGDCDIDRVVHFCPTCEQSLVGRNAILTNLNNNICDHELNHVNCCFDSGDCFFDR